MNANILIVEDELIIAFDLKMKLKSRGFDTIKIISSGEQAIQWASEFKPDVILMDIVLHGKIDGIEAAKIIHKKYKIPIIYITGNSHLQTDARLKATKPVGIFSKPPDEEILIDAILKTLKNKN